MCNYCHKIVHAYLSDDMEKSIQALSEDIRVCDPNYGLVADGTASSGSVNTSVNKTNNFNTKDDPLKRIKVHFHAYWGTVLFVPQMVEYKRS